MTTRLSDEFGSLTLGDRRLENRARTTIDALSAEPGCCAPKVLTAAELEGYYRFVNNDNVTSEPLLSAHREATLGRASGLARMLVVHDTTDFRFSDECEREGLGPMDNGGQGFYAHFSLAVTPERQPLGVLALNTWTRTSRVSAKVPQRQRYKAPDKESLRWLQGARATDPLFAAGTKVVHVMDREADDYDTLCGLVEANYDFVVRASYDRRLASDDLRLKDFARSLSHQYTRDAELASRVAHGRPKKELKLYPPRDQRTTTLRLAAGAVVLRRPEKSKAPLEQLTLNLVHVIEATPPEGEKAVEWFLLTSEPIATQSDVFQIVDDYRARWLIEEYFKALKTGCSYERRQHESKHALLNALAIYIPIAWSLLNMRTQSRDPELRKRPASQAFTATQLAILKLKSKNRVNASTTVAAAILYMAKTFGGLQPSNGEPGWQILGRAYEKLLALEAGWLLALETLGKTQ